MADDLRRCAGLACLIGLLLCPVSAAAQAWVPPQGAGYAELTYRHLQGGSYYDNNGDIQSLGTPYTQQIVSFWGKVGVVPRWLMVTAQGDIFRHNDIETRGTTRGVGDMQLGFWSGLLDEPFRISAGMEFGFPTGDADAGLEADQSTGSARQPLPNGDGEFDITFSLATGVSINTEKWPLAHFWKTTAGYQLQTEGARDAITWGTSFGIRVRDVPVLERIWIIPHISGRHALGSGSPESAPAITGLSDSTSYLSPGFTVTADIYEGLGVKGGMGSAFQARNIVASASWTVGVFYDWQ